MSSSRSIAFLLSTALTLCLWAGTSRARHLVQLLSESQLRETVTPDSFFNDVKLLKEAILQQEDTTSKAIYQATLAHLLTINTYRSQSWHRDTPSHPDSIQEWSGEEYMQHATRLYQQSLRHAYLLHAEKSAAWFPLVQRGKDEKVYGGDMLSVIWKTYCQDVSTGERIPSHESIISLYREDGLGEASLRIALDSLNQAEWDSTRMESLLRLKEEYREEDACALIYMALADQDEKNRKTWLEEALSLYPHCRQRAEIKNRLTTLKTPILCGDVEEILYPNNKTRIPLRIRHMQGLSLTLYRLPADFEEDYENDLWGQVKRKGEKLRTWKEELAPHPAEEEWKDTICCTTPDCGIYAMVMGGKTNAKLEKKAKPGIYVFRTSRLAFLHTELPGNLMRIIVIDRKTGAPQEGVTVELYKEANRRARDEEECILLTKAETNRRGIVEYVKHTDVSRFKVHLSRPGDECPMQEWFWSSGMNNNPEKEETEKLHVYTDRSIYRPGQTIYIGGVAYKQKGWDAHVVASREYQVTWRDCKRKEIARHTLHSDTLGVWQDSLTLSENATPGTYQIQVGDIFRQIRVEEYRRPTFYVELEPDSEAVGENIILKGRAMTYADVPVAGGRVTGKIRWSSHFLFPYHNRIPAPIALDTLWTDQDGRFEIRIPALEDASALHRGMMLRVNVDVLDKQGETQQGEKSMPVCTTPLRLQGSLPKYNNRDKLSPWTLTLYSRTFQPVEGEILYQIQQGEKTLLSFAGKAGKPTLPEELAGLSSGEYHVRATAEVKGDTASWEGDVKLLSMNDTRPVGDEPLWLYTPCDTISEERPAMLQIGSPLSDAWLYCTLLSQEETILDTLVHLSDSLITWTLPYRETEGHGMFFTASLYHDGKLHSLTKTFLQEMPDTQLKMHWDTFRDHLQPSQQEEWSLTLRHSDGSPAHANLMLSLYDASLDALSSHQIHFSLYRDYRIPYISTVSPRRYHDEMCVTMNPRLRKTHEMAFSQLNPLLFDPQMITNGMGVTRGMKKSRMQLTNMVTSPMMLQETVPMMAASPQQLTGAIAGLDTEVRAEMDNLNEGIEEEEIPLEGIRTNLNELAFFRPCLRTDAQGQVSIRFTLPESLTQWHLTGFAHTKDLQSVNIDETIVAQKELMAELYLPRFLRRGDKSTLTASIRSLSECMQTGTAIISLQDGASEKTLFTKKVQFNLSSKADTTYTFEIPSQLLSCDELIVRWVAQGTDSSDGEQRSLPILSDEEWVTETRAFSLSKPQTTHIPLSDLFAKDSKVATHRNLTVEYTTRPNWLAVKSLPSLFIPARQDVLSLASAYYATTLTTYLLDRIPEAKELIDSLKYGKASSIDYRMSLISSLRQLQYEDGSIAWFPSLRGNVYQTCEVAYLLTRLKKLTEGKRMDETTTIAEDILRKACLCLAKELHKEADRLHKEKTSTLSLFTLRTLYILEQSGFQPDSEYTKDMESLMKHMGKGSLKDDPERLALSALVLMQSGQKKEALEWMEPLLTLINHSDGAYLAYHSGSFTSIDRKLERHILTMEAIRSTMPQDTTLYNQMSEWLLQQKRAQQWSHPSITANAVYALLQKGMEPLTDKTTDVLTLSDTQRQTKLSTPTSSVGYLRDSIPVIRPRELKVVKHSAGTSWGTVYATCLMPMDSVIADYQGLNVRRDLSVKSPQTGDRIHIRYTITADRDYEFVCLTAPRPATAEPDRQLSGYGYQNGLGYWRSTSDNRSEYYFDTMPRGTYIVEEDWIISHPGDYQLGSTLLKCLYAPEYQSHTHGERILVKPHSVNH